MHSQVQRGISLIILPLPSERAGERLLFPIPSSQVQRGISLIILPLPSERAGERLFCSPSPFGEGWGEASSGFCSGYFSLDNQERKRAYRTTLSPPINEKGGRASLRDLHRNLVSNYYKIVISKVGFLSIQATSLSRQSLSLQQRERCCASAESLNSLGIVHHIIDT